MMANGESEREGFSPRVKTNRETRPSSFFPSPSPPPFLAGLSPASILPATLGSPFHPGHNAKIARRLPHCPVHRRYKSCKIEKTPRLNAYIICVNTHGGGGSRRIVSGSLFQRTLRSSTLARSLGAAGGYTGNDDNDDNGDNDEYDERGISPPPLSPRG